MTEELQRKYLKLQLLRQQANALLEEKSAFEDKIGETITTINAIKELGKVSEGNEIWSPLGSDSFIRSNIKDKEKVMINIGAGIVARESREKASSVLESKLKDMGTNYNELIEEINKLGRNIEQTEKELQALAEKSKK